MGQSEFEAEVGPWRLVQFRISMTHSPALAGSRLTECAMVPLSLVVLLREKAS